MSLLLSPHRSAPLLLAVAACAALSLVNHPANAQSAADKAEAESLFDEAGKLLRGGNAQAACPKLERSLQLDRGIGTLLFLAECYERLGRTASAWATFREAAAEARAVGQTERERIASSRAKKLDASVPKLRIDVPEGTLPVGAEVVRDARPVDPSTFGAAIAVDPGLHVILITAPGHEPARLERSLDVGEEATIRVTPLTKIAVLPGPASEAPPPPRLADEKALAPAAPRVRWPTYVVGGAGLAFGAVGAVFGVRTFGKWSDAQSRCDARLRCSREGLDHIEEARSAGTLSTLFVSASVAALSVSGYMLWRDLRPEIALQDRGLALRGRF